MTVDLAFLQSRDGARRVFAGPGRGGFHHLGSHKCSEVTNVGMNHERGSTATPPSFGSLARLCHSILIALGNNMLYGWQVTSFETPGSTVLSSPLSPHINILTLIRL